MYYKGKNLNELFSEEELSEIKADYDDGLLSDEELDQIISEKEEELSSGLNEESLQEGYGEDITEDVINEEPFFENQDFQIDEENEGLEELDEEKDLVDDNLSKHNNDEKSDIEDDEEYQSKSTENKDPQVVDTKEDPNKEKTTLENETNNSSNNQENTKDPYKANYNNSQEDNSQNNNLNHQNRNNTQNPMGAQNNPYDTSKQDQRFNNNLKRNKRNADQAEKKEQTNSEKSKQPNNNKKKKSENNKKFSKDEIKSPKELAKDFLKKHPQVLVALLVAALIFFLLIIILLIIAGSDGGNSDVVSAYLDPQYDFNQSVVTIIDANGNELDEVPFAEFIKGATYAELYSNIDDLSDDELLQVTKAYMLVIKSLTLQAGNYNSANKQMQILSGNNGIPYCDIYNGCNIYSYNGGYLYLTSNYNNANLGTAVNSIDAADSDIINIIDRAYQETYNLLLMPNSYNTILTTFPQTSIPYNQNIRNNWLNLVKSTDEYEELIKKTNEYQNYKIYNISEYSATYNYSSSTAYWWPLGASSNSSGIDSGRPASTRITSNFGYRTDPITGKSNKSHNGLDIGASCGINVIATRAGKVIEATESSSCGFYVKIDHGDGTASRYCHMLSDLQVKKGQSVEQGTIIGHVGSTGNSTGCHLHFEVWKNNSRVNPLDYISTSNPRPKSQISVASVNGSNAMQSVCLTLKSSGFSNDAVAAIMSNMRQESNFRLDAVGDNGTSYGLCQWHNGRYNKLQNYCGNSLNTVECQLSYLINELQTSYVGVYSMLLTNNTAHDLTEYYCYYYEVPANRDTSCANRANNYANSFLNYVNNGCK